MMIDSIIIKLIRGGAGIGPDYSLTIQGSGKVIYDGKENVKVKGLVETTIDNDKVISLLSEFKEADFFNLNDTYAVEDSINRPYTIISISIPKETGEMTTKRIKYHHGDKNVPNGLKNLEDKIDVIVGSNKWVGDLSDHEGFKTEETEKPPSFKKEEIPPKPKNKKRVKLIGIAVVSIVAICILIFSIYAGIIDLSMQGNGAANGSITHDQPEILNLTTASNVNNFEDYDKSSYFEQGDNVYIYQETANINSNDGTSCDIKIDVSVEHDGVVYHSATYFEKDLKGFSKYNFTTTESWPLGEYLITVTLLDKISNKSSSSQTNFTIVEYLSKNLGFTVVNTASDVRGFQDYDPMSIFYPNETIYVYEEYKNATLLNSGECDLYLDIIVSVNNVIVHSDFTLKSEVKNNAHYWFFVPGANWTTGVYTVTTKLIDYPTSNSISKTIVFTFIKLEF